MKSMKRTIAMLLTLALVFASFPLGAFAEQELVAEQSNEVGGYLPLSLRPRSNKKRKKKHPWKSNRRKKRNPSKLRPYRQRRCILV